jgi:hypothetical protein
LEVIKHVAWPTVVMFALGTGAYAQMATVRVSGRAVDRSGAVLPGVKVTLAGSTTRTAVTDGDGRYLFTELQTGSYTVTAVLPGFQTNTRTVIAVAHGAFVVDFRLDLDCLLEGDNFDLGLPTNIAAADAVLYVRITDAGRSVRLTEGGCVEGFEHKATVLAIIKSPRLSSDTIRLVRAASGGYRAGDEVIVFLQRHPSSAFVDFGWHTFLVDGGRVHWTRSDLPGVIDGSPVRDVLEGLRNTLSMIR